MAVVRCAEGAMSKVYSFRLSANNPREAHAREMIPSWMEAGYSLRQIIVDALINYNHSNSNSRELNPVMERLQFLLLSLEEAIPRDKRRKILSTSILESIKKISQIRYVIKLIEIMLFLRETIEILFLGSNDV